MIRIRTALAVALTVLSFCFAAPVRADVKLNSLFTDGAVLQQGIPIPVWGTSELNEKIVVRFMGQTQTVVAKDGNWIVHFNPARAGGPYEMDVQGENTLRVRDLLVGEVWLCSGQSNMQWTLSAAANAQQAIAGSADPQLRLYSVPRRATDSLLYDVGSKWVHSAPDTSKDFSAVGYFFGRELRKALKVPVGLIDTSYGGTPAEAWMSKSALQSEPQFKVLFEQFDQRVTKYRRDMLAYDEAAATARASGVAPPTKPNIFAGPESPQRPMGLYNAMIHPLIPYGVRGAIWYQGESNAGQAYLYRSLFPAMIRNWRNDWKERRFPFFFVQLAPFQKIDTDPKESAWAELREAQLFTTHSVIDSGMAVITDVGDEADIHPRKKEPVGQRLALAALAIAYRKDIEYSGPTYASKKIDKNRIIVRFKHAKGLTAPGGEVKGFAIAGEDRKFVNAKALVQGASVVVWSERVPQPVAVRYGWANYPVVNLQNDAGLLASPFRTDDWPGVTQPKTAATEPIPALSRPTRKR